MPLSAFIGREEEIARLRDLTEEHRLVTVVGPGGIGKTRLVLELCAQVGAAWPGDPRRCELAPVTPQRDLAIEIAAQLGSPSLEAVVLGIGDDRALIVLDNCEHVLGAAASVCAQLLDACPGLHVLATSREPLALDGERVFVLGPLRVAGTTDPDEIASAPATLLFADRARMGGARWSTAADHLRSVAELCRRLDGIPLAIELAAARARSLAVGEMLGYVDRRFDLLQRSGPIGTARHQSLRAAIDTSYELLPPEDQAFFQALGVFAGPFDATLAHAVAAPASNDSLQTIDRLARLVDRSLVVAEQGADRTRYRLLDSLRDYARERASEARRADELRDRFTDAMARTADEITAAGLTRWSASVLAAVLSNFANLCAAADECVARDPSGERAFRILLPLWGAIHQGRARDVATACDRVLTRWPAGAEPLRAEVLAIAANAQLTGGTAARAIELAEAALAEAEAGAIARIVARRTLGLAAWEERRLEIATDHFTRGRELASEAGLAPFRRELSVLVEWLRSRKNGVDAGLAVLTETAAEAAAQEDHISEIWAHLATIQLLLDAERIPEARAALSRTERVEQADGYPYGTRVMLRFDAVLRTFETSWTAARAVWRNAIDELAAAGDLGELALTLETAAILARRAGDDATAEGLLQALPRGARGTVLGLLFDAEDPVRRDDDGRRDGSAHATWSPEALRRVRALLASAPALPAHESTRSRTPAEPTARATSQEPAAALTRSGDGWIVRYAGRTTRVRHMKGIEDLARLLERADEDLHCLDLMGASDIGGDAGPALDDQSRRVYRSRVRELQEEIDDARAKNDTHRAERAEAELDRLVEQLSQAFGLGGRARPSGATAERARAAVTWRIRAAIRKVAEVHADLGRHLRNAVRTGTWCSYRPESAVAWTVSMRDDTPS